MTERWLLFGAIVVAVIVLNFIWYRRPVQDKPVRDEAGQGGSSPQSETPDWVHLTTLLERVKAGETLSDKEFETLRNSIRAGFIAVSADEGSFTAGGDVIGPVAMGSSQAILVRIDALTGEAMATLFSKMLPKSRNYLPAPPPDFKGRDEQIKALTDDLLSGRPGLISAVRGLGGIGKTTLAAVVGREVAAAFPDGLIWVALYGTRPHLTLSPETAMGRVIHSFDLLRQLPPDPAELQAEYRAILRGKRCLILLDDARDVDQVKPLLPPEHNAVLITSRLSFQLEGMKPLQLPLMPLLDAMALLREIVTAAGRVESDNDLRAIAELSGRLPLALRAAGAFLAENSDWKTSAYIAALRERRLTMLKPEDPDLDVRTVLGFSHEQLLEHQPALARYWRLLWVFPAEFERRAAAAVWDCGEAEAQDALSTLYRRAMVEYDPQTDRYRFHDLMRDLAEEEFKKRGEKVDV